MAVPIVRAMTAALATLGAAVPAAAAAQPGVASPVPAGGTRPAAVSATAAGRWVGLAFPSSGEVASSVSASWAVGQESWHVGTRLVRDGGLAQRTSRNLVVRCAADRCAQLNPPDVLRGQGTSNQLLSVAGTSSQDVWVGGVARRATGQTEPVLYHWDGGSWSRRTVPYSSQAAVYGLSAKAPGDLAVLIRTHRPATVEGSIPMRLRGSSWTRFPLNVQGCDNTQRGHYFSRLVQELDVTGTRPVAIGVCADARLPNVDVGFAAVRRGTDWVALQPVADRRYRRYQSVASAGGHGWFAVGGRTMLRTDSEGTTRSELPADADDVDDLSAQGGSVWAVGRASGQTAVWTWTGSAWVPVPAPDHGSDGQRLVAVLADGRPVIVDTGGRFPTLRRYDASAQPAPSPARSAAPVAERGSAAAAHSGAAALRGGWLVRSTPVRVDLGRLTASWAGRAESWHVGMRQTWRFGAVRHLPLVVRCRADGCDTENVPLGAVENARVVAVSGTRPDDVWVVGDWGFEHPYAAHWDGSGWTVGDLPRTSGTPRLVSLDPAGRPWVVPGFWDHRWPVWTGNAWDTQPRPKLPCGQFIIEYSTLDASGPYPVLTGNCPRFHDWPFLATYRDGHWQVQDLVGATGVIGARWFAGALYVWSTDLSRWNVLRDGRLRPVPAPPGIEGVQYAQVTSSATRLWAVDGIGRRAWVRTPAEATWRPVSIPAECPASSTAALADGRLVVLTAQTADGSPQRVCEQAP